MKKIYVLILAIFCMTNMQSIKAQVLAADSLALVDIYNAGDGPNWSNNTNWLTGNVSTWVGITVTGDRVTKLSLNAIGYGGNGGTISPSIGQLTELTLIELNEAPNLTGSIPAEIWNCTKVTRLQIKFTGVTGGIPAGISTMTALGEINFQQTYLGGEIPADLFNLPSLTKAYLHESNFTGTVPATLVNATLLNRLYLQSNQLEGPLPFVNIPKANGAKVELTGNYFSFADVKPYHDSVANYSSLKDDYQYAKEPVDTLVDKGIAFTINGTVAGGEAYAWLKDDDIVPVGNDAELTITPTGFSDEGKYVCKAQSSLVSPFDIRTVYNVSLNITDTERDSLALVDIYNAGDGTNWLNSGNWLTAPLKTWQNITYDTVAGRVKELFLNQIDMGGTLSPSIGQLTEITRFEIQNAPKLSGSIPAELWNCTKITRLQIKFTGMTGGIPAGIETMTSLGEINFQQTYLGGEIPEAVFNLPSLTKAYLHESHFTGSVPASLVNATKLVRLYLQSNKLVGPLPFVDLPKSNAAKVELVGNFFSFADVKPYHDSVANYSSLKDDFQYAQESMNYSLTEGDPVFLAIPTIENGEVYTWFYNDTPVSTDVDSALVKESVSRTDTGVYVCKVQSSLVSTFDIRAIFTIDTVTAVPAFVSGSTNEAGTQITLVFDFEIADPSAEAANFAVKQDDAALTVSSVASDDSDAKNIILTLASAISSSTASIKVSYNPGTLTGTTGGAVKAFGPTEITNYFITGIDEKKVDTKVYPNPFSNSIQITGSSPIEAVTIVDITGKTVVRMTSISEKTVLVPTSDLENGIYFITIKTSDSTFTQKISK
ncbi:MAG: T9SS type A sorting domain-containing protein [Bacteroidales bacterium]|nr:T9SS type A sorting domain-containing protein [Bacteroidales bacterium]